MKKKKYIYSCVLGLSMLIGSNSCDFLDANEYLHEIENLNEVWSNQKSVRQMWAACYTSIPNYSEMTEAWPFNCNYDEGYPGYEEYKSMLFARGKFDAYSSPLPPFWKNFYMGIRRCCIFIENAHLATDKLHEEGEVDGYVTDAVFFRAYYYSLLLELYGPFVIVKNSIDYSQTDQYPTTRATVEECVQFIVDELDKCIEKLPTKDEVLITDFGRPTNAFAMAIKARVLLWYASPLVNGNPDYVNFVNADGKPFFNTSSPLEQRWKDAATAYKSLIDLGDLGTQEYKLYRLPALAETANGDYITVPLGDFEGKDLTWPNGPADTDPYRSFKALFAAGGDDDVFWNSEVIWQPNANSADLTRLGFPRFYSATQGHMRQMVCSGLKMVDSYFLNNGQRIENDTEDLYNEIGSASEADEYYILGTGKSDHSPVFTSLANYLTPIPARVLNREARFYATIGFTGKGYEQDVLGTPIYYADHRYGGADGFVGQLEKTINKTGYSVSKWIHEDDRSEAGSHAKQYPALRFAEVYLSYAEALNEYDPDHVDVLTYLNLVRFRAGLPGYKKGTQAETRERIKQERHVEFAFEGKRYFDSRRWKDAEITTLGDNNHSLGMHGAVWGSKFMEAQSEYFDKEIIDGFTFNKRNYFLPIPFNQIENHWGKLLQNPGW